MTTSSPSDSRTRLAAALTDRYRIERELGQGGMATVYLAHDVRHDRKVALKVLRPELTVAIGAERFLSEIKTTANLQHPNILALFDSGNAEGLLFYVMPYVEGETLRARLQHEPVTPEPEAVRIATEVADALGYAHEHGIIHRDIKPENILLQRGHALVADFGIARAAAGPGVERITHTGMAVGTPAYMSPEQAAGDPGLDARSDQYSLACMLYEMLVGKAPFAGAPVFLRFTQPPPRISESSPDVVPAVDAAVYRAMARDPAERFATVAGFAEALRAPGAPVPVTDEKSIVVLPFENMSADRENEYFADGISEEIINALTQLPGLRVVARTSAFSFKGKAADLRTIGEKLQVRHVLEGSVRKAGSRLRITAQLVNAADGYHLWSERYDREMDDVFAIQDEIATTIAARLQVTLTAGATGKLIEPATDNLQAYDEYLKGMALMHRRGGGIMGAIERFGQAIALDPDYAPALAGMAQALMLSSFWGITAPGEIRDLTLDVSARALAVNPGLAEAHTAAALVAIGVEFDRDKAEREWNRAVELNPTDVDARANRAVFHLCYVLGDFDAAVREMEIALQSDPLNPTLRSQLSLVLGFGGRGSEALAEARRAIELDPDALFGQWILILALRVSGAHEEVIRTGTVILRRFGRNVWVMMGMAGAYVALGRMEEATALFDELVARSRTEYVQPAVSAIMAMDLGRRDDAVRRWAAAAAGRDSLMVAMLLHSPLTTSFRAQPEHRVVLRDLGWDRPVPGPTAVGAG